MFVIFIIFCIFLATATSFCLLFLAQHQNIQDKVVEEIELVFASDKKLTLHSLQSLELLDRVIKETLRLAPVGPVVFRENMEDFEIEDGLVIPKGTVLLLNVLGVHRKKSIWGVDADQFNPDRFLYESVSKRHPYSYLPFLHGKRNCIGHRYAMFSIKVILLKLLQNYKFSTSLKFNEIRLESAVVLKTINDILLSIEKRK